MNHENLKRSGQIPAFGNWDYANDLPITQFFESAHQAGLLRYSSFSGDVDLYDATSPEDNKDKDLPSIVTKAKEQSKKQGKVFDVAEAQPSMRRRRQGKAVDEDLYKIPPDDLLYAKPKQKKKMLGFIFRCLVPSCSV